MNKVSGDGLTDERMNTASPRVDPPGGSTENHYERRLIELFVYLNDPYQTNLKSPIKPPYYQMRNFTNKCSKIMIFY